MNKTGLSDTRRIAGRAGEVVGHRREKPVTKVSSKGSVSVDVQVTCFQGETAVGFTRPTMTV
jgi:hypothetical protein